MITTTTDAFDMLVQSLDEKDMKNKEQYKCTILLSQRIQQRISLLRREQKKHVINTNFDSIDKHPGNSNDLSLQQSPTETIIAYYDASRSSKSTCSYYPIYHQEEKDLPSIVHNSRSKPTSTVGSRRSSLTTIAAPSNLISKTLPSIPTQKNLYAYTSFDSAVELSPPFQAPLPSLPPVPPPKHTSRPLPIIQNVSKKYCGIRNLLTRTYHLENIIVTRSLVSPYLYAGKDKANSRKAILKLILVVMADYQFTFAFPRHRQHTLRPQYQLQVTDSILQQHLATWISYQPLLPLLVHAQHIYRVGIKLYIVYNIQ